MESQSKGLFLKLFTAFQIVFKIIPNFYSFIQTLNNLKSIHKLQSMLFWHRHPTLLFYHYGSSEPNFLTSHFHLLKPKSIAGVIHFQDPILYFLLRLSKPLTKFYHGFHGFNITYLNGWMDFWDPYHFSFQICTLFRWRPRPRILSKMEPYIRFRFHQIKNKIAQTFIL